MKVLSLHILYFVPVFFTTIPYHTYHVRLLHKFDKLQTYTKEKTKLDNIKYCENDIKQEIKNDCIKNLSMLLYVT